MRHLNKFISTCCSAFLGLLMLASCEGSEIYTVNAPDWIAAKVDSINKAKGEGETVLYSIGKSDFTTGWWSEFSKYYVISEDAKWEASFELYIDPNATNTYKNFALIITSDAERAGAGYKEYGAIRYDNQPSGNSEWGDYIDRSLIESNLTFNTDTDPGVDKLAGRVNLTVDRSQGGLIVIMDNGKVKKTYTQTYPMENLNADKSNTDIRCFIVVEGSYIEFMSSNIDAYDENADRQPVSLTLSKVPSEVVLGTTMEEFLEQVEATVAYEGGKTVTVKGTDLTYEVQPDLTTLGTKTLFAAYNKTMKGVAGNAVIATKTFNVVKELSAFTETLAVPTPTVLGPEDNTGAFWSAHTDNIKVAPKETKVVNFTNYGSGANNWNNFLIVLNGADVAKEYVVVRADNYGWGNGYAACKAECTQTDWEAWAAAMNGAKVTAYITNNGDGSADIKAVILGTDGVEYVQTYTGINTIDPDDMYFRFTIDGCHLVFDKEVGASDCSTGFWGAHSRNVQVKAHQVCTFNFTNYGSGANNWNNYLVVLNGADVTKEYVVVRADNYGWGNGYAACKAECSQTDWGAWAAAMNGAKVTVKVSNNGDGTADIVAVAKGTDGVEYTQSYSGINTIDADDMYVRFTVDGSYLVFE